MATKSPTRPAAPGARIARAQQPGLRHPSYVEGHNALAIVASPHTAADPEYPERLERRAFKLIHDPDPMKFAAGLFLLGLADAAREARHGA